MRPRVIRADGEALRQAVLGGGGEHVRLALDGARQLASGRIGRLDEVVPQLELEPWQVELELRHAELVGRVLVGQRDVVENFGAIADARPEGAPRQLCEKARDGLEDRVAASV